jgi:hypothetical protein
VTNETETLTDEAASGAGATAAGELPDAAPVPVSVPERYVVLDRVYRAAGVSAIPKGVYRLNDPKLCGRGMYLLKHRIAFEVDGPEADVEPEIEPDAPDDADPEFVVLVYTGANKQAHAVKAKGKSFDVPRLMKDSNGRAQLLTIRVPVELAEEFIGRGTFQKARS